MWKKLIYLHLLFSVAIFATGFFYTPKIKGRVEIEGIPLQGKTKQEAQALLSPLFSEWQNRKVILVLPDGTGLTLSSPHLALTTDFSEVFDRALKVKKRESASFALTPTFSLCDFNKISKEIAKRFYISPKSASLSFTPNATPLFSVTPEKYGRKVDEYLLLKRVLNVLPNLKTQESVSVTVPLKSITPNVQSKDFVNTHEILASFSTSYANSQAERKHNIALATKKLHGAVLNPGESLSFNARVGERTEAKGFLKAKVIERGAFTEGVGGGVCQVSGTLYNTALLSGLTVTEYHQHSLTVSYLPPSRDAMVNYGTADLVIRNDLPHPVYLTAQANGTELKFTFYGAPTGKTFALESMVTGKIPPPEPLVEQDEGGLFPDLMQGERKVLQRAKEGMLSECYLLITEKGKTTRVLLRKNKYLPVREHVIIGGATKENSATAPPVFQFCA